MVASEDELTVDRVRSEMGDILFVMANLARHLGVEPEPLGWFETSAETVAFFDRFRASAGNEFDQILGVNYDTCHLGVEFESPHEALGALQSAGIRVSKLHLSSALTLARVDWGDGARTKIVADERDDLNRIFAPAGPVELCFGDPAMPVPPEEVLELLAQRICEEPVKGVCVARVASKDG